MTLLLPFELPSCEAPDVDVKLIHPRVVTIAGELDLELHLVAGHQHAAYRAFSAGAWPSPCPVRSAVRELPSLDGVPDSFSECLLVHGWTPYARTDRETARAFTERRGQAIKAMEFKKLRADYAAFCQAHNMPVPAEVS
jgi:hypothetical protein